MARIRTTERKNVVGNTSTAAEKKGITIGTINEENKLSEAIEPQPSTSKSVLNVKSPKTLVKTKVKFSSNKGKSKLSSAKYKSKSASSETKSKSSISKNKSKLSASKGSKSTSFMTSKRVTHSSLKKQSELEWESAKNSNKKVSKSDKSKSHKKSGVGTSRRKDKSSSKHVPKRAVRRLLSCPAEYFIKKTNSFLAKHEWDKALRAVDALCRESGYVAEIVWKAGFQALCNHPSSTQEMIQQFMIGMAKSEVFWPAIVLDYVNYRLSELDIERAREGINLWHSVKRRSRKAGGDVDKQKHIVLILKGYEGMINYLEWKNLVYIQENRDEIDANQEAAQAEEQKIESLARKAITLFEEILKSPGDWDIFVTKYIDMMVTYNHVPIMKTTLEKYCNQNKKNPNAYCILYDMLKAHYPDDKKTLADTLKALARLSPDERLLDLCLYLDYADNSDYLALIFNMIDYVQWKDNVELWTRLSTVIRHMHRIPLKTEFESLGKLWKARSIWWPEYHFVFADKTIPDEHTADLLIHKAMVLAHLKGKSNAFIREVWTMISKSSFASRLSKLNEVLKYVTDADFHYPDSDQVDDEVSNDEIANSLQLQDDKEKDGFSTVSSLIVNPPTQNSPEKAPSLSGSLLASPFNTTTTQSSMVSLKYSPNKGTRVSWSKIKKTPLSKSKRTLPSKSKLTPASVNWQKIAKNLSLSSSSSFEESHESEVAPTIEKLTPTPTKPSSSTGRKNNNNKGVYEFLSEVEKSPLIANSYLSHNRQRAASRNDELKVRLSTSTDESSLSAVKPLSSSAPPNLFGPMDTEQQITSPARRTSDQQLPTILPTGDKQSPVKPADDDKHIPDENLQLPNRFTPIEGIHCYQLRSVASSTESTSLKTGVIDESSKTSDDNQQDKEQDDNQQNSCSNLLKEIDNPKEGFKNSGSVAPWRNVGDVYRVDSPDLWLSSQNVDSSQQSVRKSSIKSSPKKSFIPKKYGTPVKNRSPKKNDTVIEISSPKKNDTAIEISSPMKTTTPKEQSQIKSSLTPSEPVLSTPKFDANEGYPETQQFMFSPESSLMSPKTSPNVSTLINTLKSPLYEPTVPEVKTAGEPGSVHTDNGVSGNGEPSLAKKSLDDSSSSSDESVSSLAGSSMSEDLYAPRVNVTPEKKVKKKITKDKHAKKKNTKDKHAKKSKGSKKKKKKSSEDKSGSSKKKQKLKGKSSSSKKSKAKNYRTKDKVANKSKSSSKVPKKEMDEPTEKKSRKRKRDEDTSISESKSKKRKRDEKGVTKSSSKKKLGKNSETSSKKTKTISQQTAILNSAATSASSQGHMNEVTNLAQPGANLKTTAKKATKTSSAKGFSTKSMTKRTPKSKKKETPEVLPPNEASMSRSGKTAAPIVSAAPKEIDVTMTEKWWMKKIQMLSLKDTSPSESGGTLKSKRVKEMLPTTVETSKLVLNRNPKPATEETRKSASEETFTPRSEESSLSKSKAKLKVSKRTKTSVLKESSKKTLKETFKSVIKNIPATLSNESSESDSQEIPSAQPSEMGTIASKTTKSPVSKPTSKRALTVTKNLIFENTSSEDTSDSGLDHSIRKILDDRTTSLCKNNKSENLKIQKSKPNETRIVLTEDTSTSESEGKSVEAPIKTRKLELRRSSKGKLKEKQSLPPPEDISSSEEDNAPAKETTAVSPKDIKLLALKKAQESEVSKRTQVLPGITSVSESIGTSKKPASKEPLITAVNSSSDSKVNLKPAPKEIPKPNLNKTLMASLSEESSESEQEEMNINVLSKFATNKNMKSMPKESLKSKPKETSTSESEEFSTVKKAKTSLKTKVTKIPSPEESSTSESGEETMPSSKKSKMSVLKVNPKLKVPKQAPTTIAKNSPKPMSNKSPEILKKPREEISSSLPVETRLSGQLRHLTPASKEALTSSLGETVRTENGNDVIVTTQSSSSTAGSKVLPGSCYSGTGQDQIDQDSDYGAYLSLLKDGIFLSTWSQQDKEKEKNCYNAEKDDNENNWLDYEESGVQKQINSEKMFPQGIISSTPMDSDRVVSLETTPGFGSFTLDNIDLSEIKMSEKKIRKSKKKDNESLAKGMLKKKLKTSKFYSMKKHSELQVKQCDASTSKTKQDDGNNSKKSPPSGKKKTRKNIETLKARGDWSAVSIESSAMDDETLIVEDFESPMSSGNEGKTTGIFKESWEEEYSGKPNALSGKSDDSESARDSSMVAVEREMSSVVKIKNRHHQDDSLGEQNSKSKKSKAKESSDTGKKVKRKQKTKEKSEKRMKTSGLNSNSSLNKSKKKPKEKMGSVSEEASITEVNKNSKQSTTVDSKLNVNKTKYFSKEESRKKKESKNSFGFDDENNVNKGCEVHEISSTKRKKKKIDSREDSSKILEEGSKRNKIQKGTKLEASTCSSSSKRKTKKKHKGVLEIQSSTLDKISLEDSERIDTESRGFKLLEPTKWSETVSDVNETSVSKVNAKTEASKMKTPKVKATETKGSEAEQSVNSLNVSKEGVNELTGSGKRVTFKLSREFLGEVSGVFSDTSFSKQMKPTTSNLKKKATNETSVMVLKSVKTPKRSSAAESFDESMTKYVRKPLTMMSTPGKRKQPESDDDDPSAIFSEQSFILERRKRAKSLTSSQQSATSSLGFGFAFDSTMFGNNVNNDDDDVPEISVLSSEMNQLVNDINDFF